VVRVSVVARGRQHDVRCISARQFLQDPFCPAPNLWEPAIWEVVEFNDQRRRGQEGRRGGSSFRLALGCARKHHVPGAQAGRPLGQAQQSSAGADLYIVRMCPDSEDGQGPPNWHLERQGEQDASTNRTGARERGVNIVQPAIEQHDLHIRSPFSPGRSYRAVSLPPAGEAHLRGAQVMLDESPDGGRLLVALAALATAALATAPSLVTSPSWSGMFLRAARTALRREISGPRPA
jgi:hypothetical protein